MLFDTHTHLNSEAFDADRDELFQTCAEQNVWMANVGTDFESSKFAVQLAEKASVGVYATIGLHPNDKRDESFDEGAYSDLITEKVVAIGECGLDYYRIPETVNREQEIERQKLEFKKQIRFAQKHSLPLVIHSRDAYEDLYQILKSEYDGTGIIHSFTDKWEVAKRFVDLGFYIALNGILLFDKTGNLAEVAKNLPSDRILTETDAPYLSPPPNRGKRNDPMNVKYVVARLAEVRGQNLEEMSKVTFNNACAVYKINPQAT